MRQTLISLVDLLVVFFATLLASALRDNLELTVASIDLMKTYLAMSVLVSVPILWAYGLPRTIWRLSTMSDYVRIAGAVATIVIATTAGTFVINRLEGVTRSLPVLQAIILLFLMIGIRVATRLNHRHRRPRIDSVPLATGPLPVDSPPFATVLIVGLNSLTELYLRAISEFGHEQVRIAGVLGRNERQTGRLVAGMPVLGQPEDVESVLHELKIHGVAVTRIVVVMPSDRLSPAASAALESIQRDDGIRVFHFTEHLGIEGETAPQVAPRSGDVPPRRVVAAFNGEAVAASLDRPYWKAKRAIDAAGAACLLIVSSPLLICGAILAAIDVGFPLLFWQQRPGLGGRPFRLYKVRTMAAAVDASGTPVPDSERLSPLGGVLRRTRLDELPQIWSIMSGEMSFIGPRPLLPIDQGNANAARLMVRPGLTGWAQVKGGRDISPADKAALDVWYILNASLWLDLRIMAETVRMVILGEQIDRAAINRAWRDLRRRGVTGPAVARVDEPDAPPTHLGPDVGLDAAPAGMSR